MTCRKKNLQFPGSSLQMARRSRFGAVQPRSWSGGNEASAENGSTWWFQLCLIHTTWIPSGKLTVCYWKSPFSSWIYPARKWWFSIAMLNYQRVYRKNPMEINMEIVGFNYGYSWYPLVNEQFANWKITIFNRSINYKCAIFSSYSSYVKLPFWIYMMIQPTWVFLHQKQWFRISSYS